MPTRRRHHTHDHYYAGAQDAAYTLIPQHDQQLQQQQQQQHQLHQSQQTPLLQQQHQQYQPINNYKNPLFATATATPLSNTAVASANSAQVGSNSGNSGAGASILIGDGDNYTTVSAVDIDDKYHKANRNQWNLRSLSTRIQATSGQALRTYIKQPLSAAAAVVTGNYQEQQEYNNYTALQSESQQQQQVYSGTTADADDDDTNSLFDDKEEIVIMAARDRTGEFANAIRSLQSRNITRAVNIRDPRKAKEVQSYSEFMMVAKYIGKNIASTYAKLEKLTLLAKKKSLFDDRPQEIQELTYIVKGDLNALNQQIARLQDISKDQRRTNGGKHLISHSSNMVLALQSKLASMSTDFKQILEVRTENLKQKKTRRDQFSQGVEGAHAANTVSPSTAKQGSLLLSEENQAVSIDMSSTNDQTPLLGPPARLQTQQQIALYDESDNYVQQRAETMQNIESTIVELGGIFQQLAHMVKEQEEIVERIDTNIQDAEINIEAAHGQLLKYFQSVSKNRWLMIKIFGVLIFFVIFFTVFLT